MTITFDPTHHQGLVDTLVQAANEIAAELEALDTAVIDLRSSWSGSAQTAYDQAQARWTSAMQAIRTALDAATTAVADTGQALTLAERDATTVWM